MKVIFTQTVPNVARVGDVKNVSDGYYRNFLQPKKVAMPATPQALAALTQQQQKVKQRAAAEVEEIKKLAGRLNGQSITITTKASPAGKLYAAVTADQMSAALQTKGYKVAAKYIHVEPIKDVGSHSIVIDFGHEAKARITVVIQAA